MADRLTDRELRAQLEAYGEKNVGPITATTRAIYIKKLNHLKAAERKANKSPGRSKPSRKLLGFSSDESDGESSSAAPAPSRGRRKSAGRSQTPQSQPSRAPAPAAQPRPALRRRSTRLADVDTNGSGTSASQVDKPSFVRSNDIVDAPSSSNSSRLFHRIMPPELNPTNPFESSDSDVDPGEESYVSPERRSMAINTSLDFDDSDALNRTYTKFSPNDSKSRGNKGDGYSTSNKYFSHRGPISSARDNESNNQNSHKANTHTAASQLTRRGAANTSMLKYLHSNNTKQQSSTGNNISNHISTGSTLVDEHKIIQEGFKTREDSRAYKWSQYISMVLLVLTGIFFAGLALLYFNMGDDLNVSEGPSSDDNWMLCPEMRLMNEEEKQNYKKTHDCLERSQVESGRELVLFTLRNLGELAGLYDCGWASRRNATLGDIEKLLEQKFGEDEFGLSDVNKKYNLRVALLLILKNPHWKIRLYDKENMEAEEVYKVEYLESDLPQYSLLCRLRRSIDRVIYFFLFAITLLVVIGLIWTCWRFRKRRLQEEEDRVHQLVDQIIHILQTHHENTKGGEKGENYMAIPHVRDMLIPPKERKKMQGLWEKAVRFLSANESRIREETVTICGEDFAVWRWIQMSGGKVWQGPAFGEHRDTNWPSYSPTPCLKIRNMFDPDVEADNNWHVRIQDAILEKCGPKHGIVHIQVDKTSREGCVFVKCTDAEAAGSAYRLLHGWWFDGSLVTVKYLRLERYQERFPDAHNFQTPMQPSNNKKLSLSRPFHHSFTERS